MESQLFKEIVGLRIQTTGEDDASERARLLRRANELRIQLMINLERERPLLARTLSARIEQLSPIRLT